MTIDLERLAVDADYWDEVAPEGASHLINEYYFVKWVDKIEYNFTNKLSLEWRSCRISWPLNQYTSHHFMTVLAKPHKPCALAQAQDREIIVYEALKIFTRSQIWTAKEGFEAVYDAGMLRRSDK
jgi:hypothetical protein